jgi:arabinose-5-phosphate isomerase
VTEDAKPADRHLAAGRNVLDVEARAVTQVRDTIGAEFGELVGRILACTGRVVVCGVGKPWFIAQKISATMASTGTPSFPLHPSEAVHGDIGRVRPEDLTILLSNSGESEEVFRIVPILRQFGTFTVALTGRPESTLGRACDLTIGYGRVTEACPLGLAPSASSTAMLALGDAIALAVLDARDFGRDDYARFHPAGALGRKLMQVGQIMRPLDRCAVLETSATVGEAISAITTARAGAAIVVDDGDGRLAGIFTDGDLRRHLSGDTALLDEMLSGVMTRHPLTIAPTALVGDALRLLREKRIDELPVVEAGKPVGMLDVQDLLDVGLALDG